LAAVELTGRREHLSAGRFVLPQRVFEHDPQRGRVDEVNLRVVARLLGQTRVFRGLSKQRLDESDLVFVLGVEVARYLLTFSISLDADARSRSRICARPASVRPFSPSASPNSSARSSAFSFSSL
jgi:hypothetical protein